VFRDLPLKRFKADKNKRPGKDTVHASFRIRVLEPLWQVEPTIALGSKDCSGLRRNRFLGGRDPFRISYHRAVSRGTIEQAFNTIWRVKFPRKLARRLLGYRSSRSGAGVRGADAYGYIAKQFFRP
jgi:hypothetical protein